MDISNINWTHLILPFAFRYYPYTAHGAILGGQGGEVNDMNKRTIIAGIVILVLIGGGWYIANQQSQQAEQAKMAQEKNAMKAKEDAAIKEKQDKEAELKKDGAAMEKKEGDNVMADKNSTSRYVEYSKSAYDQAVNKRRVLYFYASWCPICRPTDAEFKENTSKIPEDVVVLRVNYNDPDTDQEEKDLAKKYGITYQHTFVQVDTTGHEITKWNGGAIDKLLLSIK